MIIDDGPFLFSSRRFQQPIQMPSVAEVEQFGSTLGIRFPDAYISLIVKRAGHIFPAEFGRPVVELNLFGKKYAYLRELGILYHFDVERDLEFAIQSRHQGISEKYRTPYIVPICTSDVNEYSEIAFDFRASRTSPKIIEFDNDSESQDILGNIIPIPIADSFSEFIDDLMYREEFEAKYGSMIV